MIPNRLSPWPRSYPVPATTTAATMLDLVEAASSNTPSRQ